jgi:hypothetical protein
MSSLLRTSIWTVDDFPAIYFWCRCMSLFRWDCRRGDAQCINEALQLSSAFSNILSVRIFISAPLKAPTSSRKKAFSSANQELTTSLRTTNNHIFSIFANKNKQIACADHTLCVLHWSAMNSELPSMVESLRVLLFLFTCLNVKNNGAGIQRILCSAQHVNFLTRIKKKKKKHIEYTKLQSIHTYTL